MTFEEPVLELVKGSGREATAEGREELRKAVAAGELPSLEQFLATYPQFASARCIFVSGSLVEGWGNEKSDVDLFVITDEPLVPDTASLYLLEDRISASAPVIWAAIGELGPFRADIEIWTTRQVDELIGHFERPSGGHFQGWNGTLGHTERDFFYRLLTGRPMSGADWWEAKCAALRSSDYQLWLAEDIKVDGENGLEDVVGMLGGGDDASAALAVKAVLQQALLAILAIHGDISPGRKWLPQRVLRQRPPEITWDTAWEALSMRGAWENPREYARRTADLVHSLFIKVEQHLTV
ncbi:hypothetical protein [Streptomyces sp. NPDC004230]